jgi:hypothetical protein
VTKQAPGRQIEPEAQLAANDERGIRDPEQSVEPKARGGSLHPRGRRALGGEAFGGTVCAQ